MVDRKKKKKKKKANKNVLYLRMWGTVRLFFVLYFMSKYYLLLLLIFFIESFHISDFTLVLQLSCNGMYQQAAPIEIYGKKIKIKRTYLQYLDTQKS